MTSNIQQVFAWTNDIQSTDACMHRWAAMILSMSGHILSFSELLALVLTPVHVEHIYSMW